MNNKKRKLNKYTIDIKATVLSHEVIAYSEDEASEIAYQEFVEYIKRNDNEVAFDYEVVDLDDHTD